MAEPESLPFQYSLPHAPEGKLVELSAHEMEQLLRDRLAAEKDEPFEAMWQLAQFYKQHGQVEQAMKCFQDLLDRVDGAEAKANCVLSMGQTAEQMADFELAIRFYRQALSLEPVESFTWYFVHNNLGYSLNQVGRFVEGEDYCRRAININPQRPNAHKNLGIALQGQGRHGEAAEAFVAAIQADASDPRALGLLKKLLGEQPVLQFDFATRLELCERAVAHVAVERQRKQPVVQRGLRAKLTYWTLRARNLLKRFTRIRK